MPSQHRPAFVLCALFCSDTEQLQDQDGVMHFNIVDAHNSIELDRRGKTVKGILALRFFKADKESFALEIAIHGPGDEGEVGLMVSEEVSFEETPLYAHNLRLKGLPVPEPGEYRIVVKGDGRVLTEIPLSVFVRPA